MALLKVILKWREDIILWKKKEERMKNQTKWNSFDVLGSLSLNEVYTVVFEDTTSSSSDCSANAGV